MKARSNSEEFDAGRVSALHEAMNPDRQRALAEALKRALSESELTDLRILLRAAENWADQLIDHVAPGYERLREFDQAYAEREEALLIGNALNRFGAVTD